MNAPEPLLADAVLKRAAWRLITFMALMYVVSFLDRVNISFAALTMNRDLGFSPEAYGFGAGIFFWGYFLFDVPHLRHLGRAVDADRLCAGPDQLFHCAFSLGRGGSGPLSRHGPLYDLLVSVLDPGAVHRAVPGGRAALQCDRGADFRLAVAFERVRPGRLAMDADPGRHPLSDLRSRHFVDVARWSGHGQMAERG